MPAVVVPTERPDFLARLTPESAQFGVEIAEFFDSEVEARLRRLPGYIASLLDGGQFRHKENRRQLTLHKVSISDGDGTVRYSDVPAVIRRVSNLETCSQMVADIIRIKGAKLCGVLGSLDHTNLIIADRTNLLCHLERTAFYRLYCGPALRQAVRSCGFREVFFVTSFKSGNAYIPLKLLVTLAGLFLFHPVVAQRHVDDIGTPADLMQLFASYLHATTTGPVGVRHEGKLVEVLYGDSGFILDDHLAPTIRTYNDWPWPSDVSMDAARARELPAGLVEAVSAFELENTFSTEIAFPVASVSTGGPGRTRGRRS
jgi:hypothetical protein